MPLYETTYIVRQDIPQQEIDKLAETYGKIIEDNAGKIVKLEQWGLRELAYPIKKITKGYYTFFGIEASDAALKEFERRVKLNEDILRCLSFRVEEISLQPSPLIAPDAHGDEIVIGGEEGEEREGKREERDQE